MTVQLLRDFISRDGMEAAAIIKNGFESGSIVGIVFGLQLPGRRYIVNVAGECVTDPTFARGIVGALEDELRDLIQGKAQADTTL